MNIEKTFKRIIAEQVGINEDQVNREQKIRDDLGCDSLDTVEILMACEEEFDMSITDEDGDRIFDALDATVGSLIDYLSSKQKAAA